MRKNVLRCSIGMLAIVLLAGIFATGSAIAQQGSPTTQPFGEAVESYIDRTPDVLQSQATENLGPRNPTQSVDIEISGSKIPTTQAAASQPTTMPKSGDLLIVPLPSYRPVFGWGINMMGGYIFPLDKNDTVSPPSVIALVGMYTQNESWAAGLMTNLHIDEDKYRVKGGVFTGQINYDFYGVGTQAGEEGVSIPLHQHMNGALIEPLFQVVPGLYLGPRYTYAQISTSASTGGFAIPPGITQFFSQLQTDSSAFGVHIEADTRDNEFYPRNGHLFDFEADFHQTAWGDSFNYEIYKASYNQYIKLSNRQVLAVRGALQDCGGDVPFYALSQMGAGPDMRGYKPGQFRDRLLLAAQAEYRLELTDRLGLVAFGGLGEVAHSFDELDLDQLLPSLGGGVRFTLSKVNHVNLRLDAAWGREGWQEYLAIGEAF
ncbi:MAG TPA: BamA/TamA family outer membrane protein [Tepidisphaeraceae bacterium]|jgi:hypothetical protein